LFRSSHVSLIPLSTRLSPGALWSACRVFSTCRTPPPAFHKPTARTADRARGETTRPTTPPPTAHPAFTTAQVTPKGAGSNYAPPTPPSTLNPPFTLTPPPFFPHRPSPSSNPPPHSLHPFTHRLTPSTLMDRIVDIDSSSPPAPPLRLPRLCSAPNPCPKDFPPTHKRHHSTLHATRNVHSHNLRARVGWIRMYSSARRRLIHKNTDKSWPLMFRFLPGPRPHDWYTSRPSRCLTRPEVSRVNRLHFYLTGSLTGIREHVRTR